MVYGQSTQSLQDSGAAIDSMLSDVFQSSTPRTGTIKRHKFCTASQSVVRTGGLHHAGGAGSHQAIAGK